MAESQHPGNPLDVLPAMLNLMLVQTGKFFKNAASDQPLDITTTKGQLTGLGDSANRRFHEALDELEIEITRAKAVFGRDLRKERAKRAERERVAGILTRPAGVTKARSPIAGTKKSHTKAGAEQTEKDEGVQTGAVKKDGKAEDMVMVNGVDNAEQPKAEDKVLEPTKPKEHALEMPNGTKTSPQKSQNASIANPPSTGPKLEEIKQEKSASKPATPKPTEPAAFNTSQPMQILLPTEKPSTDIQTITQDPSAQEVPTQNPTSDDPAVFESMFDLDASTTTDANMEFSLSDPFASTLDSSALDLSSIDFPGTQDTSLNATSSEDINTLLPGLENYVNDSGDLSFDFTTTAISEQPVAPVAAMSLGNEDGKLGPEAQNGAQGINMGQGTAGSQEVAMEPMEDTFGELLDWGVDGDLGDGTMAEFDDEWFNSTDS